MSLDFWKTDSRRFRKLSPMSSFFATIPDLDKHFAGLDAESMATLRRFIAKTHFLADSTHLYSDAPHYAFCWSGLCSQEEYDEALSNEQELGRLQDVFVNHFHTSCGYLTNHVFAVKCRRRLSQAPRDSPART